MKILAIVLFVLGLALAILTWFLGPSYGLDSWMLRAAIGAALVLPVPLVWLFRWLAARKKARAGLSPKAAAATLALVRDRLGKLGKVLGASKVSGGAQDLSTLPWAVIVGPRGAGKTASVLRARIEIPFTTAKPDAPSDFEVHLTRAGVVVDFGGRFFAGPGTPDLVDFGGAIEAVAQAHPRKRIDAVVLAFDVGAVLEGRADYERLATEARAVLETIREASGYSPPVYVVLEKADRIRGLAEAYGVLASAERGQVLGTLLENKPDSIRARLDATVARARTLGLERLGQLEGPQRFATVAAHVELAAAVDRLVPLLEKLYLPSSLGEPARIAGVYFASTEQDGRTVSLLDGQLGFGALPPPPPDPGAKPTLRSYFAFELWAKVALGGGLATERSVVGRRRRRASALTWVGGAAVLAGLWSLFATLSFFSNQELLSRAQQSLTAAAPPRNDEPTEIERHLSGLSGLARAVDELAEADRVGAPLTQRAFLYSGSALLRPLTGVLDEHMRAAFVEPASTEVESALLDAKGSDDVSRDYDLLKAYLMVTEAKSRLDVDQATRIWLAAWQTQLHPAVAQNQALLEPLVRRFMQLLQKGLVTWRPTNTEAIQIARRSAIARGAEYQRMVADAARDTPALTMTAIAGNRYADVMTSKESIRGLYTVQGWRKVRGPLGETPEGVSAWVLEQYPSEDELIRNLEQEYLATFRSEWTKFLGGLALKPAGNVAEAGKLLDGLTSGDPLYHVLVRRMKQEMAFPTLAEEAQAALMKAGAKNPLVKKADKLDDKVLPTRAPNEVQQFFAPLLDTIDPAPGPDGAPAPPALLPPYTAKLAELATAIQEFAADEKPDTSKLEPTVAEARARATELLRRFEGRDRLRAVLEPLLQEPLDGILARAGEKTAEIRAGNFAATVCEPFYESLGGKYPFALRKEEALLDDVIAFFGPSGALKTFYESTLSKDLVPRGDDWVVESGRTVDPEIVEFYRVAMKVAQVFFPGAATEMTREFQVLPEQVILPPKDAPKVSGFTLEVGEVKQTYEFGAERTWTFAWPTKIGNAKLALLGRGDLSSIETSGDWAWFRLIDRASKAEALEGGWHRVSWFLDGVEVRVRVRTTGRLNPLFEQRLYQRLECTRR